MLKKRILAGKLEVTALGLGCMGMSEFYGPGDETDSLRVLHHAMDLGITFFDTADTYGFGHNEELVGRFLKDCKTTPVIATKFGIARKPGEYDRTINNHPDYIRQACEASLKRLGTDCIDLYYIHRFDNSHPIEVMIGTLADLIKEGKIKHIGLSEVSVQTLHKAHAVHPITALQSEYSLWTRDVEEDVLPTCRELGIGFVPYSPLGRGFLTGAFDSNTKFHQDDVRGALPRFSHENMILNSQLVDAVKALARSRSCSPAQIALAWLLAQGENIVPIPGTKRISYLEDNIQALNIELSEDERLKFDSVISQFPVAGERYTQEGMKGINK